MLYAAYNIPELIQSAIYYLVSSPSIPVQTSPHLPLTHHASGGGVRCHNMDAYTSAGFCALHSSCITSGSASGGGPGRDGHFGGENRINGAEVENMALRMRCQARSGGGRVV